MKTPARPLSLFAALTFFLSLTFTLVAQEPQEKSAPPASDQPAAQAAPAAAPAPEATSSPTPPAATEEKSELRRLDTPSENDEKVDASDDGADKPEEAAQPAAPAKPAKQKHGKRERTHGSHGHGDSPIVSILHDSTLEGGHADAVISIGGSSTAKGGSVGDAVVSIFGSSTSSAEVGNAVVSVAGDTRVEGGSVGDAAVAVLGSTYINAPVHGEVVAVLGDVELGPKAEVGGDLVCVGGSVIRDPQAVVHGQVNNVAIGGHFGSGHFTWLHTWLRQCLLLGRPLGFGANLGWAWMLALGALALYAVIALLFPRGVERCVETFEQRPGYSILTALLVTLLAPLAVLLLLITIVGAPAMVVFLVIATFFGKAVMLAWIGRRLTSAAVAGKPVAPALAVLVGGAIVLLLYTIPFIGFLVAKVLSWLGLGTVIYTLILGSKRNKAAARAAALAAATPPAGSSSAASAAVSMPPPPSTQPPVMPMSVPPAATVETPGVVTEPASAPNMSAGFTGAVPPPVNPVEPASAPAGAAAPVPPVMPSRAIPVVSPATTLPRAGFWLRLAAGALDAVLVAIAMNLLPHLVRPNFMLLLAAYSAVLWALKGTTVGGIVCGLRVVRLDDRPLDWSTAIVRALGGFLSFFVAGLGFIWVAFDDAKQSWHDKIAGTTVVIVPKGTSLV